MLGKHKTILLLIKKVIDVYNISVYLTSILTIFESVDIVNNDSYELLLDFILDFVKYNAEMANLVRVYFEEKRLHQHCDLSNRAKYKIMDIVERIPLAIASR